MSKPGPKPNDDKHLELECPCGIKFKIFKSNLKNSSGGTRKYCSRGCSQKFTKKTRYQFYNVVVK